MTKYRDARWLRDGPFRSWPHPAISVAVTLGYLIAVYPGTLPRDATTTAIVTAAFGALGAIIGMIVARRSRRQPDDQARRVVFGSCLVILGCAVGVAVWWQNLIRAAVDVAPVGLGWGAAATIPPAVLVLAIVAVPRSEEVRFKDMCTARNFPFIRIGMTDTGDGSPQLEVVDHFSVGLDELRNAHEETLPKHFG